MRRHNDQMTLGEYVQLHGERAKAEITACCTALKGNCQEMPRDYNPLTEFSAHLVEALDALLDLSVALGEDRKVFVLRQALARHGLALKE